jgi:hypothetical protein
MSHLLKNLPMPSNEVRITQKQELMMVEIGRYKTEISPNSTMSTPSFKRYVVEKEETIRLSFCNTCQDRLIKLLRLHTSMNLTLEGPYIIFCNIYTFRDTQCSSTDCLLMLRCQLYMFRTVTAHPQELLFRCCMCRLWYVIRTTLSDTSRWYNV